jgi:hypothetical protein
MAKLPYYLNWFALLSAVLWIVAGIGRSLHLHLLVFPIIALALAQVITASHRMRP